MTTPEDDQNNLIKDIENTQQSLARLAKELGLPSYGSDHYQSLDAGNGDQVHYKFVPISAEQVPPVDPEFAKDRDQFYNPGDNGSSGFWIGTLLTLPTFPLSLIFGGIVAAVTYEAPSRRKADKAFKVTFPFIPAFLNNSSMTRTSFAPKELPCPCWCGKPQAFTTPLEKSQLKMTCDHSDSKDCGATFVVEICHITGEDCFVQYYRVS